MYLAFLHGQRRGGATGGSVDVDGAGTGIPGGVRRRSEEGERESRDEPRLATQRACVRDPVGDSGGGACGVLLEPGRVDRVSARRGRESGRGGVGSAASCGRACV